MSESQNVTISTVAAKVAEEHGITKVLATSIVKSVVDAVVDSIIAGETVRLSGLGTFNKVATAARTGHNPATGEAIEIPAGFRVAFKATKSLKDEVKTVEAA